MDGMTKSRGLRIRRGTRLEWLAEHQGKVFCHCGCGEPIPLRAEHFNRVPMYLHGHNAKVNPPNKKPPKPTQPCGCGCGVETSPGMRYVAGHSNRGKPRSPETLEKMRAARRFGSDHPQWGKRAATFKGRVILTPGYAARFVIGGHPFATRVSRTGGYVLEHRLVMEEHLRKTEPSSPYLVELDNQLYLRRDIEVHHRNGVKTDNRIENLQAMTRSGHTAHHAPERLAARLAKRGY